MEQMEQKKKTDTEMCCKSLQEELSQRVEKMLQERKEKEKIENTQKVQDEKQEEDYIPMPIIPHIPIKDGVCPICRGVGIIKVIINGVERWGNCICTKKVIAMEQLQQTGIAESIEKYTFEKFQTPEEWQKRLKQKALQFLDEKEKWFFVGGQVGCGKTHICTAILGEFLNRGKRVRYILWTNEIVKLKANKMDDETYQRLIEPLLTTEVLYIDDFFKTEKGKKPSEADIRTAFEILNYRYVNANLITIISTEKTIDELIEIDEAIGSRIHQKAKGYRNVIKQQDDRNWRLKA